ncbi:Protein ANTAGONIST OF LIKE HETEROCHROMATIN like protein [Argiope bruennichi]|uniref:Protein ANTAGONIST OF LIKE HETEROCHROMATIN like protein n=1 Tax=Argiope bruennichi TaxID=94029 RepID=A0A8T0ES15_ARGBR|nr:Protein ANTAGONIST OF LIKE HETEROCHROMATIN like protein [Argiope bruennichi]
MAKNEHHHLIFTSFEYLLSLVSPYISGRDTNMRIAITAGEKLSVALRYIASGETQSSLSFQFRIAQNTISGIIKLVCNALVEVLSRNHLHVPSTKTEWEAVSAYFYTMWQFPQCIGALDGKHIKISPPPNSGSLYYVGTNGRISDGGVWGKCKLKSALDKNALNIPVANTLPLTKTKVPYVIVADDAFPLSFNLMKPYPGRGLNEDIDVELIENKEIQRGDWRHYASEAFVPLLKINGNPGQIAKDIRQKFCTYFNGVGAVKWQNDMCLLH